MPTADERRCSRCLETKPISDFRTRGGARAGKPRPYCRPCEQSYTNTWKANHRDSVHRGRRSWELRTFYGITIERYDEILAAQDGLCAICRKAHRGVGQRLHVDHCHETGRVRGLLCSPCNIGLGQFANDPSALRAAAEYLESP